MHALLLLQILVVAVVKRALVIVAQMHLLVPNCPLLFLV
jgi:hypothetical protein